MDHRELFTCKSADYSSYRPSYPAEAVEWICERCHAGTVVDIGAGTGIFTKCLRGNFQEIIAIEPNRDMREVFLRELPGITCIDSCGEDTSLPDQSVDLITVAQAFHWLDEDRFKAEAKRILKPDGKVALIWNNSLKNEFTIALNEVCKEFCPRFRSGHAGKRSVEEGDLFLLNEYFHQVETAAFSNPFKMDKSAFLGNMRSRSYSLIPDDENFSFFTRCLESVFEKFSTDGFVTDHQETKVYLGTF